MRQLSKQFRDAFTLIEMLIAMALTLVLVFAVAEFYAYVGTAVRDSRALIEMGSQLRSAAQQLHDDLNSLTLRPEPWIDPASSPGYFSIYEGPRSDAYPDGATDITADSDNDQVPDAVKNLNITTLIGDGDDMIAMTIRAKNEPFQGQVWDNTRSQYVPVSSQYAEVLWYTTFTDLDWDGNGLNGRWDIQEPRFLCRRQLLIRPDLNLTMPPNVTLATYYQQAEVSFRVNNSGQPVANSLADLSLRHCRYGCQAQNPTYPSLMRINPTNLASVQAYSLGDDSRTPPAYTRFGEDRLLYNLLAFDVRVYDPTADIRQNSAGTVALSPGDFGYTASGATQIGEGAWVDLSYNRTLSSGTGNSHFSGPSTGYPGNPFNLTTASASQYNFHVWDTWAQTYEMTNFGGYPGTFAAGQAYDGQDNNDQYGVDDPTERQTQPPYAAPLRGVQVRLRIYEPQTKQARQVTVGADFVAE